MARPKSPGGSRKDNMSETLKIQNTVFDLDIFEEVTIGKEVEFTPAVAVDEAVARLGNDSKKFLEIVNEGLAAYLRRVERAKPGDWKIVGDDGKLSTDNFTGSMANAKIVNATVLTLAKTVFGYSKDQSKAEKAAAKESAMSLINGNEVIKAGLKKSAAIVEE